MALRVLGLFDKWIECDPAIGPAPLADCFMGSLEAIGAAEVERFFYDEVALQQGGKPDSALIELFVQEPPDVMVYAPAVYAPCLPDPKTISWLKSKYGTKLVAVFPDLITREHAAIADAVCDVADLAVSIDAAPGTIPVARPELFLHLWTPLDPRIFFSGEGVRDIDVCFVGSLDNYPDRLAALQHLRDNGIALHVAGGMRSSPLSPAGYAETLRRSKISLNFSGIFGGHGRHQLKGRVFESLYSGALLLESENPLTPRFFEPGRDFVQWRGHDELLDLVRHYLADDIARFTIARAGHQRATTQYSPERFWTAVFTRLAEVSR